MAEKGKLYLIPAPLGEGAVHTLPDYVINILHKLDVFIAERAKTARHFIKETGPQKPFSELEFFELNKRTTAEEMAHFLDPCDTGKDVGLLSEAGCPAVADPGAVVVYMAHKKGIEVVPLVGPSSILLALMASGLNGQNFTFHGYLSIKKPELVKDLKRLEQQVVRSGQTQIFIETPYRNDGVVEMALSSLAPQTKLCIAADLSLDKQVIITKPINQWKKSQLPKLHKRPTVFLIGR